MIHQLLAGSAFQALEEAKAGTVGSWGKSRCINVMLLMVYLTPERDVESNFLNAC